MKLRFLDFLVGLGAAVVFINLCSCSDETSDDDDYSPSADIKSAVVQRGVIASFDSYGAMKPSFSVQDMKDSGFDYSDLIDVRIGNNIVLKDVPFITGFNEVGIFETCICDYNAAGTDFSFGQLCGNFQDNIGGSVGDSVVLTLSVKNGYADLYKVMHSVYDTVRAKYGTDAQFANFREVSTSGMGKGVLFRSSNPLNPVSNVARYAYADRLAKEAGILTEIDLADTDAKVEEYMQMPGFASSYCPNLFKNKQTIALGLNASVFSTSFMQGLGRGLKFMAEHQAPYLIHCNEGKDRCGFVAFLLEALAGASYQEVADDYMVTISNFYLVDKGSNDYNIRQKYSIDRFVWLLGNYKSVESIGSIDWSKADPKSVDLQKSAHDYVIECGLTEDECNTLVMKLKGL